MACFLNLLSLQNRIGGTGALRTQRILAINDPIDAYTGGVHPTLEPLPNPSLAFLLCTLNPHLA
jgi:hypothetical protein